MPEPNLPPLLIHIDKFTKNTNNLVDATVLSKQIPEMPQETRSKLLNQYKVPKALVIVLVVSIFS